MKEQLTRRELLIKGLELAALMGMAAGTTSLGKILIQNEIIESQIPGPRCNERSLEEKDVMCRRLRAEERNKIITEGMDEEATVKGFISGLVGIATACMALCIKEKMEEVELERR